MRSTTHIAGPKIDISGRILQRCMVCGFKLCDNLNAAMPLNPDGSVPTFPVWEAGRCVRVTEGNPTASVLLPDSEQLPKDSCIDLVE